MAATDITPSCDVYLEGYEEHGELSLAHCPQDFTSDLKARVLILDNGAVAGEGTAEEVCSAGIPDRVFGIRLEKAKDGYICRPGNNHGKP